MENSAPEREDVRRLASLSDGVIAFAMTLLVIDLARPAQGTIANAANLHAALAQGSAYASFALSFAVIALYWNAHYKTFRRLLRVDRTVLTLNLVFLFGITFLPFPTAILQRFSGFRAAVMLYAGTLAAIGLVWAVLWNHAATSGLFSDDRDQRGELLDVLEAPIVFLISMAIAWFSPNWSIRSWLLIIVVGRTRAMLSHRHRPPTEPTSIT